MRYLIFILLLVLSEVSAQNLNQLRPDTAAGSIPMTFGPYFRQNYARPQTVADTLSNYMASQSLRVLPDSSNRLVLTYRDGTGKDTVDIFGFGGGSNTHFANTDLVALGNRIHDWSQFDLSFVDVDQFALNAVDILLAVSGDVVLVNTPTESFTEDWILVRNSVTGAIEQQHRQSFNQFGSVGVVGYADALWDDNFGNYFIAATQGSMASPEHGDIIQYNSSIFGFELVPLSVPATLDFHFAVADLTADFHHYHDWATFDLSIYNVGTLSLSGVDMVLTAPLVNVVGDMTITQPTPSISFIDTDLGHDDFSIMADVNNLKIRNITDARDDVFLDGDGRLGIGAIAPIEAKVYIYGGSNGANLDIRADDPNESSTVELQSSDFSTTFQSTYLQQLGPTSFGTSAGIPNAGLGRLVFQFTENALIYTITSAPLIFGTDNVEQGRFNVQGDLQLGSVTDLGAYKLQITGDMIITDDINIMNVPTVNNLEDAVLVRNAGTGFVELRDATTIGGGGADLLGTAFPNQEIITGDGTTAGTSSPEFYFNGTDIVNIGSGVRRFTLNSTTSNSQLNLINSTGSTWSLDFSDFNNSLRWGYSIPGHFMTYSVAETNFWIPALKLVNVPTLNNTADSVLVRNSTTGNVEIRDASTLMDVTGDWTGTLDGFEGAALNQHFGNTDITFTGNRNHAAGGNSMNISGILTMTLENNFGESIRLRLNSVDLIGDNVILDGGIINASGTSIILDAPDIILEDVLTLNNAATDLLVRNVTTGEIERREVSTIMDVTGDWTGTLDGFEGAVLNQNFANTNLTADNNRSHNFNTNTLTIHNVSELTLLNSGGGYFVLNSTSIILQSALVDLNGTNIRFDAPNIFLEDALTLNDFEDAVLVRNGTTGEIQYRSAAGIDQFSSVNFFEYADPVFEDGFGNHLVVADVSSPVNGEILAYSSTALGFELVAPSTGADLLGTAFPNTRVLLGDGTTAGTSSPNLTFATNILTVSKTTSGFTAQVAISGVTGVDAVLNMLVASGANDNAYIIFNKASTATWHFGIWANSTANMNLYNTVDGNIITYGHGATNGISFAKQAYFAQTTLTDGASIAWNLNANQVAVVTLAGNRTLANPTNFKAGGHYTITIKQNGTGGWTLAYGSLYKFPGGVAPVLTTTANAVNVMTCVSDGTNMYCNLLNDYK